MGRGAVKVVVILFDILAVVALRPGQPKQALLQNGVLLVPKGQRETQQLPPVADAQQSILAPAVSPATGLVVWKIVPGRAACAIVLPHRAPLPVAQVWPPQ